MSRPATRFKLKARMLTADAGSRSGGEVAFLHRSCMSEALDSCKACPTGAATELDAPGNDVATLAVPARVAATAASVGLGCRRGRYERPRRARRAQRRGRENFLTARSGGDRPRLP